MPTIFTRLYETEAQAAEIAEKVSGVDYMQRKVDIVTKPIPAEEETAPADTVAADLAALGVYGSAASKYAAKMVPGNAVIVVNAPFGAAGAVPGVLDSVHSIDAGVKDENNLVEDVRSPTSIIQFTPNKRSIVSYTPKRRVSKPIKPFLGLATIKHPKPMKRRPSNKPLTPALIISR